MKQFKHLGRLILEARTKKDMTQIETAKQLNFSSQFLGRIEKGYVPLPWESLKDACEVLEIEPKKLKKEMLRDYERYVDANLEA